MYLQLRNLTVFFLLLTLTLQCSTPEKNRLKAYYYPYEDLQNGMIYEYTSLHNESFPTTYWYLQSKQDGQAWYMNEVYLEDDNIPIQVLKEKIVSNGVFTEGIQLILRDTSGQLIEVDGLIEFKNAFSFQAKKFDGVLVSKYSFQIPDGTQTTTTIIKNRQYEGDTTINISHNTYQTARFRVKELISMGNEKEGYTEPEFSGIEHYGKGIGLVYYKKESNGKTIFEYGLKKRYSLKEASPKLQDAIQSFLSNKE